MKRVTKTLLIFILLVFPATVFAMGSANYHIDADVINSGGGESGSANFSTLDSIGEAFVGSGSSTNFSLGEGFEAMMVFGISLSLDSATVDLGAINPGTPRAGTTIATVTTDAWGGYDLAINQDHNLTHTDTTTTIPSYGCAIGAPCVWSGAGLGFTVQSGTNVEAKWYVNPNYFYAAIPNSTTTFHTKSGYASGGDATTVEYKVDVGTTQKSGTYNNTVSYVATARI